ncbi:MAG: hypothetical protein U0746_22880 [Gemmataceae bacterium]
MAQRYDLRAPIDDRPRWDAARRELWFRGRLVKRFRQAAENQTRIIDAFEQRGWPPRIDDPMPPEDGVVSEERLHETIKALNRNQKYRGLHFGGDGLGTGVLWEARGGGKIVIAPPELP